MKYFFGTIHFMKTKLQIKENILKSHGLDFDNIKYMISNLKFLNDYKHKEFKTLKTKNEIKYKYFNNKVIENIDIIKEIFESNSFIEKYRFYYYKYFNTSDLQNSLNLNKILLNNYFNQKYNNIKIRKIDINEFDNYLFFFFNHYNELKTLDKLYLYTYNITLEKISIIYNCSLSKIKEDIYKGIQITICFLESDIGIYSIKDILLSKESNLESIKYKVYNNLIYYIIKKTSFNTLYKINID